MRDALDLCLACKGCKSDCPVGVDMATYKAEFLAHHYAGRLRPAAHYALGWLPLWARLARYAPRLVNAVLHAPGLAALGKKLAGIAPQRDAPRFAAQSFQDWWRSRVALCPGRVIRTPWCCGRTPSPTTSIRTSPAPPSRAGLDAQRLDSGCCGLAGNFGFEAGHYEVSMACAEQALLPAVRAADPGTLVLADGFSCRTQIEQAGTGRRAIHLAEALAAAPDEPSGRAPAFWPRRARGALLAVTVTAGAGVLVARRWLALTQR